MRRSPRSRPVSKYSTRTGYFFVRDLDRHDAPGNGGTQRFTNWCVKRSG
jgi:hypothetical protein